MLYNCGHLTIFQSFSRTIPYVKTIPYVREDRKSPHCSCLATFTPYTPINSFLSNDMSVASKNRKHNNVYLGEVMLPYSLGLNSHLLGGKHQAELENTKFTDICLLSSLNCLTFRIVDIV